LRGPTVKGDHESGKGAIRYSDPRVWIAKQKAIDEKIHVYTELRAFKFSDGSARGATTETLRQADRLFDTLVAHSPVLKHKKLAQKRADFQRLFTVGKKADYYGGCVMYPRNHNDPDWSSLRQQVVDAAVDAGVFTEVRSKKGNPKMSRLI